MNDFFLWQSNDFVHTFICNVHHFTLHICCVHQASILSCHFAFFCIRYPCPTQRLYIIYIQADKYSMLNNEHNVQADMYSMLNNEHNMGLVGRKPDFVVFQQQSTDKPVFMHSLISTFIIHYFGNSVINLHLSEMNSFIM